jgi:hypothetical protein
VPATAEAAVGSSTSVVNVLSEVSTLVAIVVNNDWVPVSTPVDKTTFAVIVRVHSPEEGVPGVTLTLEASTPVIILILFSIAVLEAAQLSLVEASTAFIPVMVRAAVPEAYSQVWEAASQSAAVMQSPGIVAQFVPPPPPPPPIVPEEPTQ